MGTIVMLAFPANKVMVIDMIFARNVVRWAILYLHLLAVLALDYICEVVGAQKLQMMKQIREK